jgi:single-strand DNA-binding protein
MASLNSCNFIGNIGKIETRFLPNGDAVTNCSLAVNETWKDQNGDKQERCEWVNVTAYKKLAEIMQTFCVKGMQIYVSGKMQTRKYTDKSGIEKYTTEIIASDMKLLGSKPGAADSERTKTTTQSGAGFDDLDSDIPF